MKKTKKKAILGIDIGGTKIACGVVSNGKALTKIYTEKTPPGKKILSVVEKHYKLFSNHFLIAGIGISTAGMVSDEGKIVGSSGNISNWEGTEVSKTLSKKLRLPVIVENDANAAAFAEYHIGGAKGANPLLMVTLGTGVGGGIVVNGKLVRGAHYAGGEIGHIQLSYFKERYCTCGKYDCFEAYASGNGLLALIKNYFSTSAPNISTRELFRLSKSKLKNEKNKKLLAIRAVEDWHFYVALGLANLIHVFDPKHVVLSGGLSEEINLNILNDFINNLLLPALRKEIKGGLIQKSILSNDAGLLGASLLANQYVDSYQ